MNNAAEMTNFDKYLLEKRNAERKNTPESDLFFAGNGVRDEYEKYLIKELRRTVPSENRVMSREEFYCRKDKPAVMAARKPSTLKFRRGGIILLVVYVIFLMALASILIVNSTSESMPAEKIAGAVSKTEMSQASGFIEPMSVEEEKTEETALFDRLCDSLNK